jgi:rare lipoprotein A
MFLYCCSPSVRSTRKVKRAVFKHSSLSLGDVFFGQASYYADKFHGKKTANGEIFNMYAKTAAHKYFPFNTIIEVTNQQNGKSVVVRINDRGPFKKGRILDLSYQAAMEIDMIREGIVEVKLKVLKLGKS